MDVHRYIPKQYAICTKLSTDILSFSRRPCYIAIKPFGIVLQCYPYCLIGYGVGMPQGNARKIQCCNQSKLGMPTFSGGCFLILMNEWLKGRVTTAEAITSGFGDIPYPIISYLN